MTVLWSFWQTLVQWGLNLWPKDEGKQGIQGSSPGFGTTISEIMYFLLQSGNLTKHNSKATWIFRNPTNQALTDQHFTYFCLTLTVTFKLWKPSLWYVKCKNCTWTEILLSKFYIDDSIFITWTEILLYQFYIDDSNFITWTEILLYQFYIDDSNFITWTEILLFLHWWLHFSPGDGAVRMDPHAAERVATAFTTGHNHPRQGHGRQPVLGWGENCRYHLQVCIVWHHGGL